MVNLNLEWKHSEEKEGNIKEHYLNIPVKVVNSVDSGYGYHGQLICNECQSNVEQFYICSSCKDKAKIGEIKQRKDDKTELIYEEQQRAEFMKNEVDKTLKVVNEINIDISLLRKLERFEKTYEIYTNEEKVNPVILKIYNFLIRENKALVVAFGYSNRGKSNELGGLILAGDGKLCLVQLRDYRLIRPPKQEGLPQPAEHNGITEILDNVSENRYPEMYEKFLEAVKSGEKIEVTIKEKPKIEVECDFLD